jgi:hypothetical protein
MAQETHEEAAMTDTQSLSERLREFTVVVYNSDGSQGTFHPPICTEAADTLDANGCYEQLLSEAAEISFEIAVLKEGRQLHDELADHLEHEIAAQSALIAQAAAALEHFAWDTTGVVLLKEGPVEYSRKAREALAAIRAKEHP